MNSQVGKRRARDGDRVSAEGDRPEAERQIARLRKSVETCKSPAATASRMTPRTTSEHLASHDSRR